MTSGTALTTVGSLEHLVPHFTRSAAWSSSSVPIIVRGEGCFVFDEKDDRYLDGLSGLFCVNMGHGRPDVARAGAEQLQRLAYWTNWAAAHPAAIEAAELIASLAPAELSSVFFVNSGSEAVEAAIKLARQYHREQGATGKTKIIARDMAYHGTTMGALSVTGIPRIREPFMPLLSGVRHFPNTLGEQIPEGGTAADLPSLRALNAIIEEEGAETIAVLFAEPVQNSRGALVPPDGYWQELQAICNRHDILLVADEVITAFGRVGSWFASADYGALPDMITFAKGSTSGYAPLGGVIVRDEVMNAVRGGTAGSFIHGATWGGHPVATAIAVANITAMRDEKVLDNVKDLEGRIQEGLDRTLRAHSCVREWRGSGFFYAMEFTGNRQTGRELTEQESVSILREVMPASLSRSRVITRPDDRGATMLTIAPPLVANDEILNELLDSVENVAANIDSFLAHD